MEDSGTVELLVLLKRRFFLVVLRNNVVAGLGLGSGVDDDDIAIVKLGLHGIALHPQREVVLSLRS